MGRTMSLTDFEAAMTAIPGHPARMKAAADLGKQKITLEGLETASPFVCTYGMIVHQTQKDARGLEALARRHEAFVVRARAVRCLAKVDQPALAGLYMTEGLSVQLKRVCLQHLTIGSDAIFEAVLHAPGGVGHVEQALGLLRRLQRTPAHQDLVVRWMSRLTTLDRAVRIVPYLEDGACLNVPTTCDMPGVYASTAARYPPPMLELLAAEGDMDFRWYRAAQVLAKTHPDDVLAILQAKMWQPRAVWYLSRPLIRHRPKGVLDIFRERRVLNGAFFQCFKKSYGNGAVRREMVAILRNCLAAGPAACEADALDRTVKYLGHRVNRGTRPCDVAADTHALLTECLVAMARGGASILESRVWMIEDDEEDSEILNEGSGDVEMRRRRSTPRYRFPHEGYTRALTYAFLQKKVVPLVRYEQRVDLARIFAETLAEGDAVVRKHAAEMIAKAVGEGAVPAVRAYRAATAANTTTTATDIVAGAFERQLQQSDGSKMFRCMPLTGPHGVYEVLKARVAEASFFDLPYETRCNVLAYLPVVAGGEQLAGLANSSEPDQRITALKALWRCATQQEVLATRQPIPPDTPPKTAALLTELNAIPTALAYIAGKLRRDHEKVYASVISHILTTTPHTLLARVPPATLESLWRIVCGGSLMGADPRAFEPQETSSGHRMLQASVANLVKYARGFAEWACGARVFAKMAAPGLAGYGGLRWGAAAVAPVDLQAYSGFADTVFEAMRGLTLWALRWVQNSTWWRWRADLPDGPWEDMNPNVASKMANTKTEVGKPLPFHPMADKQLQAFKTLWCGSDAAYLSGCDAHGDGAASSAPPTHDWLRLVDHLVLADRGADARGAGDAAAAAALVAELSKQRDYAAAIVAEDINDMVNPLRRPMDGDSTGGMGVMTRELFEVQDKRGKDGTHTEGVPNETLLEALALLLLSYRTARALYEGYGMALLARFPCVSAHAAKFFEATASAYPWTPVGPALALDLEGIRYHVKYTKCAHSEPYKPCPTKWPAYAAIAEQSLTTLAARDAYQTFDEHVGEYTIRAVADALPSAVLAHARVCRRLGLNSEWARRVCGFAAPAHLQRLWRGVSAFQETRLALIPQDNDAADGKAVVQKKKLIKACVKSMMKVVEMVPDVRAGVVAAMEYMLACRVGDGARWLEESTATGLRVVAEMFQMWRGGFCGLYTNADGVPRGCPPEVARVYEDVAALLVRVEKAHTDANVASPVLARTGTGTEARCPKETLVDTIEILFREANSLPRDWGPLAKPWKRLRFAHTRARAAASAATRARLRRRTVRRMQQWTSEPRAMLDALKELLDPSMFAGTAYLRSSWLQCDPLEGLLPPLLLESVEWAFGFMMAVPGSGWVGTALGLAPRALGGYHTAARGRVAAYLRALSSADPPSIDAALDNVVTQCLAFLMGPKHMRAARARAVCGEVEGGRAQRPPRYPLHWADRYGTTWVPGNSFEAFPDGLLGVAAATPVVKRYILRYRQDLLAGMKPPLKHLVWYGDDHRFPGNDMYVTPMHAMLPDVQRHLHAAGRDLNVDDFDTHTAGVLGTMLTVVPLSSPAHPVRELLAGAVAAAEPDDVPRTDMEVLLTYLRVHPYPKEALKLLAEHICTGLNSKTAIGAFATTLACVDSPDAVAAAAALLSRDDVGASARTQIGRALPYVTCGDAAVDLILKESRIHDPSRTADKGVLGQLAVTLCSSPLMRTHRAALWPIIETLTAARNEASTAGAGMFMQCFCGQAPVTSLNILTWPTSAPDGVVGVAASFVNDKLQQDSFSLPARAQRVLRKWLHHIAGCPGARVADIDAAALVAALKRTPDCELVVAIALALSSRGHPRTMEEVMASKLVAFDTAMRTCDFEAASSTRAIIDRLVRVDRRVLASCQEGVIAAAKVLLHHSGTVQHGLRLLAGLVDWKFPEQAGEGAAPAVLYTMFEELYSVEGAAKGQLLQMLLTATAAAWDAANSEQNHLERKVVGYLRQAYPSGVAGVDDFVPVFTAPAKLNHLCLVHAAAQRAARHPDAVFPKALEPVLFALARESGAFAAVVMSIIPASVDAKQRAKEEADATPVRHIPRVYVVPRPVPQRLQEWRR